MSALGHKQTCAAQNVMSALPPIATAKADAGKRSCPLYPQKQTCAVHKRMSALGQKRTFCDSLDQFVGALLELKRNVEPERLGGLEIDHQFEFDRGLDGKLARLLALEDAIDIACRAPIRIELVNSVGQQAA